MRKSPPSTQNLSFEKEIERNFPFSQVSEIANRESNAKRYYRPILTLHKWFARRLGSVFRSILIYASIEPIPHKVKSGEKTFWDLYLKEHSFANKSILDPFMGGGTTIIEALRLGYSKVVGGDLNPVAWFTVKKEVEDVDLSELQTEFESISKKVKSDIQRYYKTLCSYCSNNAEVMYYFWIKEIICIKCQETIPLFRSFLFAYNRKDDSTHYVICPDCNHLFLTDRNSSSSCPKCSKSFESSAFFVKRGRFFCPSCEHTERIVNVNERQGKPSEKLYAIEFYCPQCEKRGFKTADETDIQLFKEAELEFDSLGHSLPLPNQRIPPGAKTQELLNHKISYFTDMYNKRQLLSLGKLLSAILDIVDQNIREFLLVTFSTALEYNNLLCEYHRKNHYIYNLFRKHAYPATLNPCENNPWGARFGTGTFKNFFKKIIKIKMYSKAPYEIYIDSTGKPARKQMSEPIVGEVRFDSNLMNTQENITNSKLVHLYCHSSSKIPLPRNSIDLVVTDPPYYDNVQYAELADFYYVWLRLGLKDSYPWFVPDYSPKDTEIVKNIKRGKSDEQYQEGLSAAFEEISRVLKDDGLFIFTFHHKEIDAWLILINSLINQKFIIKSIYPVHSEMKTSTQIRGTNSIGIDVIFVCRKQLDEDLHKEWDQVRVEAKHEITEKLNILSETILNLSEIDRFVLKMGIGLKYYTKYHHSIKLKGEKIPIKEILEIFSQY
ncbi:MAG: DUF1156 domain-containing protein [Candidatus Hodarchaeales archaeon]|jgi:adenine-specific DNA methylase